MILYDYPYGRVQQQHVALSCFACRLPRNVDVGLVTGVGPMRESCCILVREVFSSLTIGTNIPTVVLFPGDADHRLGCGVDVHLDISSRNARPISHWSFPSRNGDPRPCIVKRSLESLNPWRGTRWLSWREKKEAAAALRSLSETLSRCAARSGSFDEKTVANDII